MAIHNQQLHYAAEYDGDTNWNHTDLFQTWGRDYQGNEVPSYNIQWVNCRFVDSGCQMGNTETDGGTQVHDWTFINCIWANIGGSFVSGIPSTKFYNCLFYKCGGDNPVLFYEVTGTYSSLGRQVKNCAFFGCGPTPAATNFGALGDYHGDVGSAVGNYFAAYVADETGVSYPGKLPWVNMGDDYSYVNGGNPSFSSETNFHLQSGSPLIGAGVNLSSIFTQDADGNTRTGAWNIGPYQTPAP